MNVKCPVCKGKGERKIAIEGKAAGSYPAKCDYCNGSGKVPKSATYAGIRRN